MTVTVWTDAPPQLPSGGEWITDAEILRESATDMGNAVHQAPAALVRPQSTADVASVAAWCTEHNKPLRARGTTHQMYGQSLTPGVAIDMTSLTGILDLDNEAIDVAAGTMLDEIVEVAYGKGKRLRSGPISSLNISVGGVLAAGGISPVISEGALTDSCLGLEIVTASGDVLWCSPTEHSAVFYASLGGLGQAGIITRARLAVCEVPRNVHTWDLSYMSIAQAVNDLRVLSQRGEFDELFIRFRHDCTYHLRASVYVTDSAPATGHALRGLSGAAQVTTEYLTYLDHCRSTDCDFAQYTEWPNLRKSWSNMLLGAGVDGYLQMLNEEVDPDEDLSPSSWGLLIPHQMGAFNPASALRLPKEPDSAGLMWTVGVLSDDMGVNNEDRDDWWQRQVQRNERWHQKGRELGGVIYAIGSDPMTPEDADTHWEGFTTRERALSLSDPQGLFGPWAGLNHRIFGSESAAPDGETPDDTADTTATLPESNNNQLPEHSGPNQAHRATRTTPDP